MLQASMLRTVDDRLLGNVTGGGYLSAVGVVAGIAVIGALVASTFSTGLSSSANGNTWGTRVLR